jgi:glutamate/tyrosine decarboxylase-like PLP-dependent enzyme
VLIIILHSCHPTLPTLPLPTPTSGAGTIGSTEACLLAGLALKFRWRKWYGQVKALNETQASCGCSSNGRWP